MNTSAAVTVSGGGWAAAAGDRRPCEVALQPATRKSPQHSWDGSVGRLVPWDGPVGRPRMRDGPWAGQWDG